MTLELTYKLSDLPSSQHRAGLAGLVCILQWRATKLSGRKGLAEVRHCDEYGARFEFDEEGLADVFDIIYAAAQEERTVVRPYKAKDGSEKAPLRTFEKEVTDKNGKVTTKTYYVYPDVVPRGAYLLERDPTREGDNGVWIKLWRDFVWNITRGKPASRQPFNDRAASVASNDASKEWSVLNNKKKSDKAVDLAGTLFLGGQATTAEDIKVQDKPQRRLLLHFWPYTCQLFVPQVPGDDGKREFVGFAVVMPDVSNLVDFVAEIPELLTSRSSDMSGYRPRASVVDLPVESGLQVMSQLHHQLGKKTDRRLEGLLSGLDVFHLEKTGNSVNLRSRARLMPDRTLISQYLASKDYWNLRFRSQWLQNVIEGQPRWTNFDRLCATTSIKETFDDNIFRHDAFVASKHLKGLAMNTENKQLSPKESLEALVFAVARQYVSAKVARKNNGLNWKSEDEEGRYGKEKEAVARSAFLAIRSRNNADFIDFFSGTLCSVPQFLPADRFALLSQALLSDTARVRTLTLMALSAAAYSSKKEKKQQ